MAEEPYRQPFVESLIAAATRPDSPATVVLTLRADFYGQAIGLSRSLSDAIQQGLVNLGPMTRDELCQAIEAPAKRVGLNFEPGLVARLLDDVKGQPGNLPLLEFALKELWQRRQGATIINEQYDAIGTLEEAISRRADAQFERVPPAEREAVLHAFTRLLRVSATNEEGTDTRQRVRLNDLDIAEHPAVKSFVKERLLVMSRDEETNEEIVEVAHEALIRRWERLKARLDKDREFLLWRQRLSLHIKESNQAIRTLNGPSQKEAQKWLEKHRDELSQTEKEFIAQGSMFLRVIVALIALCWGAMLFGIMTLAAEAKSDAVRLGLSLGFALIFWGGRRYASRIESFLIRKNLNYIPNKFHFTRKRSTYHHKSPRSQHR